MRKKLTTIYMKRGWSMSEAVWLANNLVDKYIAKGYSEEEINTWPAWKVIPY